MDGPDRNRFNVRDEWLGHLQRRLTPSTTATITGPPDNTARAFLHSETCTPPPLGRTTRVMGPRSATHGRWFPCIDPVPRYPAIGYEIDDRAATATGSGRLDHDPVASAGLPTYKRVAKVPGKIPIPIQTRPAIRRPCNHNATRYPRQLRHFTDIPTNMLANRRPRPPCRPAGAWAMFLTNDT